MEARAKRRVRSGVEYDHLFPRPEGKDITIKKDADVSNTVKFIQNNTPKICWQTAKIAKKLKGKTLEDTCSNIWHFVYGHIAYKRDEDGVEQVRSPRRAWYDRVSGVDCDCYTVFISSILMNLGVAHKYRITKYPKAKPEDEKWQHIYPVVPLEGRLNDELSDRDDYIVLDCVKDKYDEEEPYLDNKDYKAMRLDYLDGIEEESNSYSRTIDAMDIASVYDDELGKISLKNIVKKVGGAIGKGIRAINRVANPVTILLRNGFLLAMKINMMNVAGRLRYAYITDEKAKKLSINMAELAKLRKIKDKAEDVYYGAGGKRENLKKAILTGKGNKDGVVAVSGLAGLVQYNENDYADIEEYNVLNFSNPQGNTEGLGDPASGASLAAATAAVSAIAVALKQVKDLFPKNSNQDKEFQSEADTAISQAEIDSSYADAVTQEPAQTTVPSTTTARTDNSSVTTTEQSASTETDASGEQAPQGFFQRSFTWVKENPIKSLLIGALIAGGTYLGVKAIRGNDNKKGGAVSGLPNSRRPYKKKKSKPKYKKKKSGNRSVIKVVKLT